MKEFYTPEELAGRFKLNRMTIYRLLRAGKIPSVRIGKSYRITADELDHWLGQQKTPTPSPLVPRAAEAFVRSLEKRSTSFKNKLVRVVLFGSYARGSPHEQSDIDLLVIEKGMTDADEETLLRITTDAELKSEDDISLLTKSLREWNRMREAGSVFYRVIMREGHSLWPERMPMKSLIEREPLKR